MRISSRKKYRIKESTDHTNYSPYEGSLVPSVTSILKIINKDSIVQWANSLGWKRKSYTKELDDASLVGTLAHNYIEAFIFDRRADLHNINMEIDILPYELNEKVRNCINSFLLWWREEKQYIRPIASEIEMCCDYYGGTLDFLCWYHGKLAIIDFKTSGDFYPTMYMQLAAYAEMYEELFDVKIEETAILRMDKKKGQKAQFKSMSDVPGGDRSFYFTAFNCALDLYRYMHVLDTDWND